MFLRGLLAAAVGAAIVLPSVTQAEPKRPHLPKGFVASSGKLGPPTVRKTGRGGMQGDHEFTFPVRPKIPGDRADVSTLPVVALGPEDDEPANAKLDALPPGIEGDLVVLKVGGSARLSIRGFEAGVLRVGKAEPQATGRQSQGGIPNACGRGASLAGIVPVKYEALRRVDEKGTLELVWGRAYLDASSCKLSVLVRRTVRPRHLGGGLVYAFRTERGGTTGAPPERALHVLLPQGQSRKFDVFVPFERRVLPLEPGKSGAFEGHLGPISQSAGGWGLPSWYELVETQCRQDEAFCFSRVRFEISQGLGEPAPTTFLGGDLKKPKAP
jgi:hypothetical protein